MGGGRTQPLPADQTVFFWLTVRPPVTTAPGTYRATIAMDAAGKQYTAELVCEVLPFILVDSPIVGGAFMAGTDLSRRWYQDMKVHGINAIQMFWGSTGMDVRNIGGKLVMDFDGLDRFMEEVNAGGIDGPITISLGNDSTLHYECDIALAFGMPIEVSEPIGGKRIKGPKVSPELDKLFVEGLRQIREHWDAKGYRQELVVLIYDEPTERLLERCQGPIRIAQNGHARHAGLRRGHESPAVGREHAGPGSTSSSPTGTSSVAAIWRQNTTRTTGSTASRCKRSTPPVTTWGFWRGVSGLRACSSGCITTGAMMTTVQCT